MSYKIYTNYEANMINTHFLLANNFINNYTSSRLLLRDHYKSLLYNNSSFWEILVKKKENKIYKKKDLNTKFFENTLDTDNWHFGCFNKSHYILNGLNEMVGCLNLIFLSIFDNTYLFYFDTIEIKKQYRRKGLGTKLIKYMIENEVEKYDRFNIFLLVANCEQYKLKFFSSLGFIPVKLRITKVGTHCIMSYPYNDKSELLCQRMFDYFNWREEKKEIISSDCKFAFNPNPTGLYWCAKKNIYVTGLEKQNCPFYIKDKEIYNEMKFLTIKNIIS